MRCVMVFYSRVVPACRKLNLVPLDPFWCFPVMKAFIYRWENQQRSVG